MASATIHREVVKSGTFKRGRVEVLDWVDTNAFTCIDEGLIERRRGRDRPHWQIAILPMQRFAQRGVSFRPFEVRHDVVVGPSDATRLPPIIEVTRHAANCRPCR